MLWLSGDKSLTNLVSEKLILSSVFKTFARSAPRWGVPRKAIAIVFWVIWWYRWTLCAIISASKDQYYCPNDRLIEIVYLFDNKSTHAMSNKDSLFLLSQKVLGKWGNLHFHSLPEMIDKLSCKVRNIEDVVWLPNFIPYPNVIILEFPALFTLESQGSQNELVSGSVQVPSADPPRPWTKIIFSGEVDELGGSTRILRPNWVEVLVEDIESWVAGEFFGFQGHLNAWLKSTLVLSATRRIPLCVRSRNQALGLYQ